MSAGESDIQRLFDRFVEDGDSLTDDELSRLVAAAGRDRALLGLLRDQLVVDELLRQKLSADRADFLAQVRQRVTDHELGEHELDARTAELRRLAMKQLAAPPAPSPRRRGALLWASLACALLAVAVAGLSGYWKRPSGIRVTDWRGEAAIARGGNRRAIGAENLALELGDQIETPDDSSVTIRYGDGTSVTLEAGSAMTVERARGKELFLTRGALSADIAPQPTGQPMVFRTLGAEAIVVGTQLRLRLGDGGATELEVLEGAVELREAGSSTGQMVASRQIAVVTPGRLTFHSTTWPLDRRDLALLLPTGKAEGLRRDPRSGALTPFPLVARGGARIDGARALILEGGAISTDDSTAPLLAGDGRTNELTLEVIFRAREGSLTPAGALVHAVDETPKGDIAASNPPRFVLAQDGEWLIWRMDAAGETREFRLATVEVDAPQHLVLVLSAAGLAAHLNGRAAFDDRDASDLARVLRQWKDGELTFGADEEGNQSFRGEILGVALYDRAFTPEEAAASSRRLPVDVDPR